MIAPQAWVDTLDERERAAYDEIIKAGYEHEQAVDAIVRDREERAELDAIVERYRPPGSPGRRKRRAKNKVARASRKRNRR